MLGSVGQVGNDSLIDDLSSASIIALPVPPPRPGMTFSFGWHGPTNGLVDAFLFRTIFEGDIVTVGVPGPPGPNNPIPAPLPPPVLQVGANLHFRMLGLTPCIVPPWRVGGPRRADTATEKPSRGEIVAVGNGKVLDNGEYRPLDVKVAAVKAPGFGERRKAMLEDIAILTGGTVISEE